MKSLEAINQNLPGNQAKAVSETWGVTGKSYRKEAEELLAVYLKAKSQLEVPVKVKSEG